MRYFYTVLCCFLHLSLVSGQDLSGLWRGVLFQENKTDTFFFQLHLVQDNDQLSGESFSRTADGVNSARFSLTGVVDSHKVILQEIMQLEPSSPKWCLKYLILNFSQAEGKASLTGDWKAEGCTPGKVILESQSMKPIETKEIVIEKEEPFSIYGKWTGYLNQSDRDYGFYYEVSIDEAESVSYIVSEGNGGSAHHELFWDFTEEDQILTVRENFVKIKTDDKWKWCIKSARLKMRKEAHSYILEGDWEGYLEGHGDSAGGACAPGRIFLEKPIETYKVTKAVQQFQEPYEVTSERKIKIQRVLAVQRPNLKIRVWDNGTVDGDVVTLFLNGNLLFENYRVSKTKHAKLVKLNEENNFLILHAEDLGDISPNTVAVSIDDGFKEQIIILSSNLKESGALMIKQFKLE